MKPLFKIAIVFLLIVGVSIILFNLTVKQSKSTSVEVYALESEPTNSSFHGKIITIAMDGDYIYGYEEVEKGKTFLRDSTAVAYFLKQIQKQNNDNFQVVIKPSMAASYQSVVDMLDHMTIHKIKNFTLDKPSNDDIKQVNKKY